ncbi:hypothetical protein [Jeotgalibacillus proteolyticus]|uniref:Uncharacterized protein n=1 Tax=Jeotgalibacillus proteolyticus TaxID=2082395 RepID=A0A2S5GFK3_9BACL|nr:hypothetical protein [Jeotgalibacillus proteolyticus]PPA71701.1 hypothetical protein C4B60_06505 [Jeotgalibacillus proteolyticus]
MKSGIKLGFLLFAVCSLSWIGFIVIFGQQILPGLFWACLITVISFALFAASIYGFTAGKVPFLKLTNLTEGTGVFLTSLLLFAGANFMMAANLIAVYLGEDLSLDRQEKIEIIAKSALNPYYQEERVQETLDGITYTYPASRKKEINSIHQLIQQEKNRFYELLGTEEHEGLTIELHENYSSLEEYSGLEDVSGYYEYDSKSIHLAAEEEMLDFILLHEYTHYQSHLFAEKHYLPPTRIPHWFEEGIADYLGGESTFWYELEDVEIEITDFTSIDTFDEYDGSRTDDYDPYLQSYLAVEFLVKDYGEELIPELLLSKRPGEFYEKLEAKIEMDITEFQETFLDDLITAQIELENKYELVYDALEDEQYAPAEALLQEIITSGNEYDQDYAKWLLTDSYLEQERYADAISLLEDKISNESYRFKREDLLFLAEISLLFDPEKSLVYAQSAIEETIFGYGVYAEYDDQVLEAYSIINSENPLEGYRILLQENLLYNDNVLTKLSEKLAEEFPEETF